jgi:CheY-like chemotaxis protein
MLPRVFDMFMQVGRSIDHSQGGLGIGLTLVRRLLEMHGGTVSAESGGIDQGSTFIVRLPLGAPVETPAVVVAPAALQPARRILVVDDNTDAAESLAILLNLDGHTTRVVHDGESALSAATEFLPDAVFLDIGMPGMNGYETARRLRGTHGGSLRLIALTGWGTEQDRRLAQDAGFDHHLVKPVDPAMLGPVLAG